MSNNKIQGGKIIFRDQNEINIFKYGLEIISSSTITFVSHNLLAYNQKGYKKKEKDIIDIISDIIPNRSIANELHHSIKDIIVDSNDKIQIIHDGKFCEAHISEIENIMSESMAKYKINIPKAIAAREESVSISNSSSIKSDISKRATKDRNMQR